jgi:hypothetical protein
MNIKIDDDIFKDLLKIHDMISNADTKKPTIDTASRYCSKIMKYTEDDWTWLSKKINFSDKFLTFFQSKICWQSVFNNKQISYEFMRTIDAQSFWKAISAQNSFDEKIILEFKDKLDWSLISKYKKLPLHVIA